MKTDTITPKNRYSLSGTIKNHTNDEINKARSHKNDEKMSRMILMGESAIVNINIARGAPKAKKAQPKNSATVIVATSTLFDLSEGVNSRISSINENFLRTKTMIHFASL